MSNEADLVYYKSSSRYTSIELIPDSPSPPENVFCQEDEDSDYDVERTLVEDDAPEHLRGVELLLESSSPIKMERAERTVRWACPSLSFLISPFVSFTIPTHPGARVGDPSFIKIEDILEHIPRAEYYIPFIPGGSRHGAEFMARRTIELQENRGAVNDMNKW